MDSAPPEDPGTTEGSVQVPYKLGQEQPEIELPDHDPTSRREAFEMAKRMLAGSPGKTRLTVGEILALADWLMGVNQDEEPEPAPTTNTASAYEAVKRERPSGLAFLYMHPPCLQVAWRDATETLRKCEVPDCPDRNVRWVVLHREKA